MIILKQAREKILRKQRICRRKVLISNITVPTHSRLVVSYICSKQLPSNLKVRTIVLKEMIRKKRKEGKLDMKWTGPFKITASLGCRLY